MNQNEKQVVVSEIYNLALENNEKWMKQGGIEKNSEQAVLLVERLSFLLNSLYEWTDLK